MTDFPLEQLPALLRAAADQIAEARACPEPFSTPLFLGEIRLVVCGAWDISEERVLSDRRDTIYTHPRFAAWHLAQDFTHCSFPVIGRAFNRDHTTVMHGISRAKELLIEDPEFIEKYEICEAKLRLAA